jgi:hemoglobin
VTAPGPTARNLLGGTGSRPVAGDIATRDDVLRLVRAFYREAAVDDVLAPVFHAVHLDWSDHIPRIADFWCWQLLGDRDHDRHTLAAHRPAHEQVPFTAAHYERWLAIFDSTVDDLFAGPVADLAKHRAHTIARGMQRYLSGPPALDPRAPGAHLP